MSGNTVAERAVCSACPNHSYYITFVQTNIRTHLFVYDMQYAVWFVSDNICFLTQYLKSIDQFLWGHHLMTWLRSRGCHYPWFMTWVGLGAVPRLIKLCTLMNVIWSDCLLEKLMFEYPKGLLLSERYDYFKTQSRGFETSRNLVIRRLTT